MLLEPTTVAASNVRCASADEWLPPAPSEVAVSPPPDGRVVAAALESILQVADAVRQAVEEGHWLQVEERRTEVGGREIRIVIHT